MEYRLPKDIIRIKCESCETITELHESDFEYYESSWEGSPMGTSTTYQYDADFTCGCCGNRIKVCFQMSEYPIEASNDIPPTCIGGEILD
ncbi:MAG: hypothetical protein LIP12_03025 [Clostridiales bacterium]|nr:hypothetical protein [Clostridiales bacterium]